MGKAFVGLSLSLFVSCVAEAKFLRCDIGETWQIFYNYANSEVYRYSPSKGVTDLITEKCQCSLTCRYGEGSPKGPISVDTQDDSYRLLALYAMKNLNLGNIHRGRIAVTYEDGLGRLSCQELGHEGYDLKNCVKVDLLP